MLSIRSIKKLILSQGLYTSLASGLILGSTVFAQEKVESPAPPNWAVPEAAKIVQLPIQKAPQAPADPFLAPRQPSPPTTQIPAARIQVKGAGLAPMNADPGNKTIVISSANQTPSQTVNKGSQQAKPTVITDPLIKQAGNEEPGLLEPEIPGSFPFPTDEKLRMTPPESSVFDTPQQTPEQPQIPAADQFEPQVFTPPETSANPAPALSQPEPFSLPPASSIPSTTEPAPFSQAPASVNKPSPAQTVYNPPTNSNNVDTDQSAVAEDLHEVQPGENYWTISRTHYGTARYFAALAEYNRHRIPRPDRMKPGMFVLVPQTDVLEQRYPTIAGIVDAKPSPESLLEPGFFIGPNNQPFYRIGKGDTLTEIAENHLGRTARWTQIVGMNRDLLRDGNTLKIGMVLRLPHDASQVSLAPAAQ